MRGLIDIRAYEAEQAKHSPSRKLDELRFAVRRVFDDTCYMPAGAVAEMLSRIAGKQDGDLTENDVTILLAALDAYGQVTDLLEEYL